MALLHYIHGIGQATQASQHSARRRVLDNIYAKGKRLTGRRGDAILVIGRDQSARDHETKTLTRANTKADAQAHVCCESHGCTVLFVSRKQGSMFHLVIFWQAIVCGEPVPVNCDSDSSRPSF